MPFANFIHQLKADLVRPLPGRDAQYRMAPRPRRGDELNYTQPPDDARQGGVLVLFYPKAGRRDTDEAHLPLILRPTYDGVHSGQVALPGGAREPMDENLAVTALREAFEEVGVIADQITVLGQLSPLYIYASNFLVQPLVAYADARPDFQLDAFEVERLLETPLHALLDEHNRVEETWQLRGRSVQVPFFALHGLKIWGATAMMLSELLSLSCMKIETR